MWVGGRALPTENEMGNGQHTPVNSEQQSSFCSWVKVAVMSKTCSYFIWSPFYPPFCRPPFIHFTILNSQSNMCVWICQLDFGFGQHSTTRLTELAKGIQLLSVLPIKV